METTKTAADSPERVPTQELDSALINEEKTDLPKDANVEERVSGENSEYDSADSYSEDEQDVKVRSRASDQEEEQSNSDTAGSLILEREEGDGQESVPSKKIDDDEDKKNPQYIPKRGTFYEHDDRTADDVETTEPAEVEKDKDGKKKVWEDKKEKWTHDRFNDNDQSPKSRAELVAIYGYDIRNEDGPPRARRRRRYGRGPNKYTRNWEDEDAYNKPPPVSKVVKKQVRPKKTDEDFPPLGRNNSGSPEQHIEKPETKERKEENVNQKTVERSEPNKENYANQRPPLENNIPQGNAQDVSYNKTNQQRAGTGRAKPKKEIKDSDYRGFTTKTRQQRNLKIDQQNVPPPPRNHPKEEFIQTQNFSNKSNVQEIDREMSKMSIDGNNYKGGKHGNQRQGSVPPRLQNEQKGSKRYSSMRQRSLPEANTPPVPNYQHTSFYPNDYNQQPAHTPHPQPHLHQNPQIHPTTSQVAQMPPPNLASIPQVPVTAAPLLQAPFPQAFPQPPPAFLQPGVAAPAFIAPQPPQIINYVQGQPPFAPNFQGYQQTFNPVTQPAELYQPQGGITYYSTDQQIAQRPVPQKRPKAAIPIVAPPSNSRNGEVATMVQPDAELHSYETSESVDVQQ